MYIKRYKRPGKYENSPPWCNCYHTGLGLRCWDTVKAEICWTAHASRSTWGHFT